MQQILVLLKLCLSLTSKRFHGSITKSRDVNTQALVVASISSVGALGANVNLSDANNATALHYAVMFNNKEITTLLVDAKADVNLKNNVGKTPLDFAKMHNDTTLNSILEQ